MRFWRVRGYDGTKLIYEKSVSVGLFTARQVKLLLQFLTERAGLSEDEIFGAMISPHADQYNCLLEVKREGPLLRFVCGTNPHFIADVIQRAKDECCD